jgi:hypothetical protein
MSVQLYTPSYPYRLPGSSTALRNRDEVLASTKDVFSEPLHPIRGASLLVSGLRTPPVDGMSTTYHPQMATYNSHDSYGYPASLAHSTRSKAAGTDPRSLQQYRYPSQLPYTQPQPQPLSQQQPQPQPQYQTQVPTAVSRAAAYITNVHPAQPATHPAKPSDSVVEAPLAKHGNARRDSETLVFHSLRIPKCISPTGGNLAEFAAEMTCLFWFQSTDDLKQAETIRSRSPTSPIPRLSSLAQPEEQFHKWVYTVLSTTQVTQNVILLALLFIYRLKMSTPQIKGRAGSEYRLLTVALMLGNKFLDDNTYTNKTWAEVSCFAVHEIHVMEVEFLSNMRYNLLASKSEWEDWLVKLAHFHEYYARALRLAKSPLHEPSPTHSRSFHSSIPSPTATVATNGFEMLPVTPSASRTVRLSPTSTHSQNWTAYESNAAANALSPLAAKPIMDHALSRKRSFEEDLMEHPAKRPMPPRLAQVGGPALFTRSNGADNTRLPVPQLSLMTGQASPAQAGLYQSTTPYAQHVVPANQGAISLPPLQAGVRAMATVYQQSPGALAQPPTVPSSTPASVVSSAYISSGLPVHANLALGTPHNHQPPGSLAPFGSSPLAEPFGAVSAIHTPMANSPSVYLQQRASPYKPIRHVNTLLYPPPSASLDQYHLAVQPTQMHYQPLGRRNDLRTGVVPEFVVYNRSQYQPHPHSLQQQHMP